MVSEELTRKLREIITEQASTAVSNYFADNAMLAYEDDAPVPTLDNRAIEAYKGCKQELCRFMSNILMADMLANNLGYAECVLFLPDGDMTINVGVKCDCDVECSISVEQELVRTKIGIFDTFTWQMLCDIKRERNPVKVCFEHVEEYLHFMLCKLDWREKDLIKGTITKELLDEYHIQEPVPIHNLINMYWGIGRFCNDGKEL